MFFFLLAVIILVLDNGVSYAAPSLVTDISSGRPLAPCRSATEHAKGSWVAAPERAATTAMVEQLKNGASSAFPICCTWDSEGAARNSQRLCHHGSPKDDLMYLGAFRGPLNRFAHGGGNGCSCKDAQKFDAFSWVPDSCSIKQFDARAFCLQLRNRTLLIIGDSTAEQTASVLMGSVRAGFPWHDSSGNADDALTTGCQHNILFAVGDTLIAERFAEYNRGQHWTEHVRRWKPDLVIVSAGPHIMQDDDMERVMDEVIESHLREFASIPLIWRTNFPGGCAEGQLQHPFVDEEEALSHWRKYSSSRPLYNYDRFADWDALAARKFASSEARASNRFLLDISPLMLRPDAHTGSAPESSFPRDCLHMCLPGPLHPLFAQLFHRLLTFEIDTRRRVL